MQNESKSSENADDTISNQSEVESTNVDTQIQASTETTIEKVEHKEINQDENEIIQDATCVKQDTSTVLERKVESPTSDKEDKSAENPAETKQDELTIEYVTGETNICQTESVAEEEIEAQHEVDDVPKSTETNSVDTVEMLSSNELALDDTKVYTDNEPLNETMHEHEPSLYVVDEELIEAETEYIIEADGVPIEEMTEVIETVETEINKDIDVNEATTEETKTDDDQVMNENDKVIEDDSLETVIPAESLEAVKTEIDVSKTEDSESIEEKLQKITFGDENDHELQEKNVVAERRRSKRRVSQKIQEKFENKSNEKNVVTEIKAEIDMDEIKTKIEEIQINQLVRSIQ